MGWSPSDGGLVALGVGDPGESLGVNAEPDEVQERLTSLLHTGVLLEVFEVRAVVTSPGVLPKHMTVESALAGGHPRTHNELIANFMMAVPFERIMMCR